MFEERTRENGFKKHKQRNIKIITMGFYSVFRNDKIWYAYSYFKRGRLFFPYE